MSSDWLLITLDKISSVKKLTVEILSVCTLIDDNSQQMSAREVRQCKNAVFFSLYLGTVATCMIAASPDQLTLGTYAVTLLCHHRNVTNTNKSKEIGFQRLVLVGVIGF